MEVLPLTILFSAALAILGALGYVWDQRNRRDEGYDRDALRPLDEDGPGRPSR